MEEQNTETNIKEFIEKIIRQNLDEFVKIINEKYNIHIGYEIDKKGKLVCVKKNILKDLQKKNQVLNCKVFSKDLVIIKKNNFVVQIKTKIVVGKLNNGKIEKLTRDDILLCKNLNLDYVTV